MRSRLLYCVFILVPLFCYASPEYLHRSSASSSRVCCVNLSGMTADERIMTLSLQGLVNRGTPEIYTYSRMDGKLLEFYKKRKYITRATGCRDILDIRDLNLNSPAGYFRWYRKNILPH